MKLLHVLSLVAILDTFHGDSNGQLTQNGCIQASNGRLPLPNLARLEDGTTRFRNSPIQAIITSYRFNCCGMITGWGTFVEGVNSQRCYSISFEVWRINSSLGDSCYSKIGTNYLQEMCLEDVSHPQLINVTVPETEWISVQPGDVVGFNFTDPDDRRSGILISRDELYSNESVLYLINERIGPTSLCNVGQFRSTTGAPLITAIIVPTNCIKTTSTSVPQLSPTFPIKSSEITTQHSTASLASATTHTSMKLNKESSATTTKLIPKPTNSVSPNMNAGVQMLTIGVAVGATSVVMLIILFVCVVCCAIVRWKRNTSVALDKKTAMQRNDYDTAGEDTYEEVDHIHTEAKQNLAYDNNEGLNGEVELKLTQNEAYGNINHPSVLTIEDELYDNVTVANTEDEGNYDYTTITNDRVRQSSSDNDPSYPPQRMRHTLV